MTTVMDLFRSDYNLEAEGHVGSPIARDILWRDGAGDNVLWLMNDTFDTPSTIVVIPFVPPDWHFKAGADFDGPGTHAQDSDILWQNDNGALALWQMNGTSVTAIHALPNPGPTWHVVGNNDFNLDGRDDILFQNDDGSVAIWTIASAATGTVSGMFAGIQNPGPTWHPVGTGDTDGDSKAGILWQNTFGLFAGELVLWENPTFSTFGFGTVTFNTVALLPTVDASWHVKGMADVNFDFHDDIVFQDDSGAVAIWEMGGADGTTVTAMNLVNINPGPAWHVVSLSDLGGNGAILFEHDSGALAWWAGYQSLGGGSATFTKVVAIDPNPNPNGHVWDLL